MGRLTLNVLLSFAQFEREVTGERIRDKIAASKKKGIWMGGVVPLGYRVESRKLVVDEAEAETVRLIFHRYLDLGSLPALQRDLHERGITSRPRVLASGREIGGVAFTNGPLAYMLKNRMVLGELQPSRHQLQERASRDRGRRPLRGGASQAGAEPPHLAPILPLQDAARHKTGACRYLRRSRTSPIRLGPAASTIAPVRIRTPGRAIVSADPRRSAEFETFASSKRPLSGSFKPLPCHHQRHRSRLSSRTLA